MMTWVGRIAVAYGLALGCLAVQGRWFTTAAPGIVVVPAEARVLLPGESMQMCAFVTHPNGILTPGEWYAPVCDTRDVQNRARSKYAQKS